MVLTSVFLKGGTDIQRLNCYKVTTWNREGPDWMTAAQCWGAASVLLRYRVGCEGGGVPQWLTQRQGSGSGLREHPMFFMCLPLHLWFDIK